MPTPWLFVFLKDALGCWMIFATAFPSGSCMAAWMKHSMLNVALASQHNIAAHCSLQMKQQWAPLAANEALPGIAHHRQSIAKCCAQTKHSLQGAHCLSWALSKLLALLSIAHCRWSSGEQCSPQTKHCWALLVIDKALLSIACCRWSIVEHGAARNASAGCHFEHNLSTLWAAFATRLNRLGIAFACSNTESGFCNSKKRITGVFLKTGLRKNRFGWLILNAGLLSIETQYFL